MPRRPSEFRQMVHRSESRDHAAQPRGIVSIQKPRCRRGNAQSTSCVLEASSRCPAHITTQRMLHARAGEKQTSPLAIAGPKVQKKSPDEMQHPRFKIGGVANARAHLGRGLAEAEYLDERDTLFREHNHPRISCSVVNTETGFFGNLPSDVAIEIDTTEENISRVGHAGWKVNPSGAGSVRIHDAQ